MKKQLELWEGRRSTGGGRALVGGKRLGKVRDKDRALGSGNFLRPQASLPSSLSSLWAPHLCIIFKCQLSFLSHCLCQEKVSQEEKELILLTNPSRNIPRQNSGSLTLCREPSSSHSQGVSREGGGEIAAEESPCSQARAQASPVAKA